MATFVNLVLDTNASLGDDMHGRLVVLSPGRIRRRRL